MTHVQDVVLSVPDVSCGVTPRDQTAHRVKNVVYSEERILKGETRWAEEFTVESLSYAWCINWQAEKSDQLKFAVSIIWQTVWFHAGEMSMISVEKRHFCHLSRQRRHQQKQELLSWNAFVDNWLWKIRC